MYNKNESFTYMLGIQVWDHKKEAERKEIPKTSQRQYKKKKKKSCLRPDSSFACTESI